MREQTGTDERAAAAAAACLGVIWIGFFVEPEPVHGKGLAQQMNETRDPVDGREGRVDLRRSRQVNSVSSA